MGLGTSKLTHEVRGCRGVWGRGRFVKLLRCVQADPDTDQAVQRMFGRGRRGDGDGSALFAWAMLRGFLGSPPATSETYRDKDKHRSPGNR